MRGGAPPYPQQQITGSLPGAEARRGKKVGYTWIQAIFLSSSNSSHEVAA
jgi:hypothetical protein